MGFRDFFGFESAAQEPVVTAREAQAMAVEAGATSALHALQMAHDERGWDLMTGAPDDSGMALSFHSIKSAAAHARALVLGNPVIDSATQSQISYVWGKGLFITGAKRIVENINNQNEVFGPLAVQELERAKVHDGQIFFLLHGNEIETIPFSQITEKTIAHPDKRTLIQFFHRKWTRYVTDPATGQSRSQDMEMYYPSVMWDTDGTKGIPDFIGTVPVYKEGHVFHVAFNTLSGSPWGVPDVFSGIFYSQEHKKLLEAGSAVWRAQSRVAVHFTSDKQRELDDVAARVLGMPGINSITGQPDPYGKTLGTGSGVNMDFAKSIGGGVEFSAFDPFVGLATMGMKIPLKVVLGTDDTDTIPQSTLTTMERHQAVWKWAFEFIFKYMGRTGVHVFFPLINPDPTHRQMQSIAGFAALKIVSPEEAREMGIDTMGMHHWGKAVPDPSEWDKFAAQKPAPGSTEPNGGSVTPGQGQTGKVGKLADGDHSLRDEGQQEHYKPKGK